MRSVVRVHGTKPLISGATQTFPKPYVYIVPLRRFWEPQKHQRQKFRSKPWSLMWPKGLLGFCPCDTAVALAGAIHQHSFHTWYEITILHSIVILNNPPWGPVEDVVNLPYHPTPLLFSDVPICRSLRIATYVVFCFDSPGLKPVD